MTVRELADEYARFNALRTLQSAPAAAHVELPVEECTAEVERSLTERGYRLEYRLRYLTAPPGAPAPTHDIRRWTDGDAFLDLLNPDLAPEIKAAKSRYYCTERFRVFVAHVDGRPAGWATLYVADDGRHGYLANAYTHPDFRRRGIQRDLLRARMRDAADLGLESLVTDVVEDTTSERNCERAGFRRAARHAVWVRPAEPPAAGSES